MATKDRKKLQHIHSSIADKQPTPQSLEVGEIAVNNSAKKEFLSIKNSDDKVVRFSSDSTIIDWIEKKEVMPYSGVVDNVHLDTNRSNIEIKINQVAAKNTPKYDKINGAVDIDGQPVNPSTDGGKTDGAGIAIDMSRYAMIGANPSFSSVTVTHQSNLSGTTNISNGAGGEVLNMTTTNVNANDTNWTETIANKKSTVTAEEDKIGTLNESATTRTTTVGTENLTVSGTTTEVHRGDVTITNSANVTATTNGTTTETKVGNVTENNSANKQENTTGTHKLYTTGDTCLQSTADVNVGGAANTNIGTNCDDSVKANYVNIKAKSGITETANTVTISGTTSASISGATVNVSGGSINEISTGKTCITAGSDLNIGGDANTNIGYNCAGTGIANNTNIFASTAVTINAPTTNITGDTYLSGNTYFHKTCTGLTNNEIDAAFCEVLSRGAVTMTKTTPAATSEILATYKLFQNGSQIGEDINIPKDHLLKDVSIVYGKASGSSFTACTSTASDCHWYIKLVWNVFDPSTGHADDKTTYLLADDFIKDIDDKNPTGVAADSYNNIAVNVSYDGKQNWVSATTTPTIHVSQNIYADGNISGTNITASAAIRANNVSASTISATTFTGAMSKKLAWAAGAFTADTTGYNGSADKTITVPTAISHLATRGKLTITHNGLSDTYDPASDKSMALPHSALSFSYGSVSAKTGSDSYNTSAAKSITIPTSIDDLKNYNGTCVEIPHNVCVTGTITSSGAIYSSDRNLKENIMNVSREEINKANNVLAKSFNFKSDESKRKVYGVIAQEVQEAGLDELVHTDDNGNLGVDYTSLLLLKIAYLEDLCGQMYGRILKLEDKFKDE